jgi:hypothetical protein
LLGVYQTPVLACPGFFNLGHNVRSWPGHPSPPTSPSPARGPCPQRFAKPVANSVGVCFSGTWGQNETSIEREVLEYCLHHIEGGEAELAYARGDVWEKRKAALKDWDTFCNGKAAPKLKLVA